ncbi:golgin subfamily A member 2 [Bombyx mandarina]|uniref:Golgin subfamily A member 2 n=1 Tax=Bombyx mandarina TaxID=7092 RepID=A0A6J2KEV8_BOMMA|nr:golgin subfamily A member 2 [Bombyx mandarina]
MDARAAKLELARKKLREHQEQKLGNVQKETCLKTNDQNHSPPQLASEVNDFDSSPQQKQKNSENNNILEENYDNKLLENTLSATEILICNERKLETQVSELQSKLSELEQKYTDAVKLINQSNQSFHNLQNETKTLQNNSLLLTNELLTKDNKIQELEKSNSSLSDEINNLQEQLEFTKTMLTAKETENSSLNSQLFNLQNQLDSTQLQLQQLTNGAYASTSDGRNTNVETNESLKQKNSSLEQQLKTLQKEKDNIHTHYQHYVIELNEHLKNMVSQNESLAGEVERLSNRETSLVDQISDLEIRLQNYSSYRTQVTETSTSRNNNSDDFKELQNKYEETSKKLCELSNKYEQLETLNNENIAKIKDLEKNKDSEAKLEEISLSKLNADIASDKIAAQKATEQNKILKQDMQNLEDAFVKMSKDKLELTEKLSAEKFLNRELTIKLADAEEKAKDMLIKLKAKDSEMIRLQSSYRQMEINLRNAAKSNESANDDISNEISECEKPLDSKIDCLQTDDTEICLNQNDVCKHEVLVNNGKKPDILIAKDDAMKKLQERFLKIMSDVADLSDEKHRLEHIILQLQNETDTICEYVALYQQQRSLLKRRDEERSIQLNMFETECSKLKRQLEELTAILVKLSEDEDISSCLQKHSKNIEIEQIMKLLTNLNNNSLIDPMKKSIDFKDFYPCSCCSGKLMEI